MIKKEGSIVLYPKDWLGEESDDDGDIMDGELPEEVEVIILGNWKIEVSSKEK